MDRGAGFYDLYQWVRERYKKSVFLTMGNHEFGFMEDLFSERFLRDSFVDSYGHFWYLRDYLNLKKSSVKQMAKFFSRLPIYYDVSINGRRFLLVHAYISDNLSDLDEYDCIWNRELALEPGWDKPIDGATVVFGHTPTLSCEYDEKYQGLIYSESGKIDGKCWTKINIDCGCAYGGKGHLGLLRLDDMAEFYESNIDELVDNIYFKELDVTISEE